MPFLRYLLFFFIVIYKVGLSQQFSQFQVNPIKGLPSSEAYCIIQDKQKYIWVSTNHGVSRYNGKEFTTYTTANGLLDNTVFRMCEDSKGNIWFASQSNELCYWNKGKIHKTPASELIHKLLFSWEYIQEIYADSSDNIWINTIGKIIVIRSKNNYTDFYQIDSQKASFELVPVSSKAIMMRANHLLTFKHPSFLTFQCHTLHSSSFIDTIHVTPTKGEIYSSTERLRCEMSAKGVYYASRAGSLFIIEKNKPVKTKKFTSDIIKLLTDNENNLWIGTLKNGIYCYKNSDLESDPVVLLENLSVDDIYIDHEGGIWLATLQKGVFYTPTTAILNYSTSPLLNDRILYLDTMSNQLFLTTQRQIIHYKRGKNFENNDLLDSLQKKYGALKTITRIKDTVYINLSFCILFYDKELKQQVCKMPTSGGNIYFPLDNQEVWSFSGGGIRRYDHRQNKFHSSYPSFRTTYAIPMKNDIYVAGKKGLWLFSSGTYENLEYIDTLLRSSIVEMVKTKDGSIWITTIGNGILWLKDKKVKQFLEKDGLISNICTAVCADDFGNIWCGSNKGISCIQPTNTPGQWKIKNIREQNGLNSNEITHLLAFKDSLWVGSMAGINAVLIHKILNPLPPSPAYITSVTVNNTLVPFDQQLYPYNQNNFRFTSDGLLFKDKGTHTYHYRLTGFDTTWRETDQDEIVFNNLSPGKYLFEIGVTNTDNIRSTQPSVYSFTIKKPFWLTWWFIVLEIILLIAIVYFVILWRTYIIKKKEEEKLRINKLLAEYQMKALTSQMNPHFIFNAINSIQNFIIQNHSTLAYDYLIKFSKLIRLVLNNSNEKEITLQQELDTMAIYIELEQLRFKDSFEYILEVGAELETDSLMLPSLLLQPYIENAIWHGLMPLKTHKGMIRLSIKKQNESLNIRITDNGVGRTASDQLKKKIKHSSHKSIGMELTGKRIEIFGQDNSFSINILDNYDELNNPTGTTVEIILPIIEIY